MANRDFKSIKQTLDQDTIRTRFDNMLTNVNNMLARDNIYSTWIRLDIGKSEKNRISFNSSSNDTNKNLILGLDFEKVISGAANKFTIKIAFDLFHYGQNTKGNVEALDELIYKALNISNYEKANDQFYCKFQYGYNVTGDTQLVSPIYEGMITDIKPSVDYMNGKTYYTIEGTSFVLNASVPYTYPAVKDENGLEVVARILWHHYGHPDTKSALSGISGIEEPQDPDVTGANNNNIPTVARFMIDVPENLRKNASKVTMSTMNDMTPIDYIKEVLSKTFNTADPSYKNDEQGERYDLADGLFKPYYTYYLTDSGGNGVPTIHITYIASQESAISDSNGLRKINFNFEWFNRSNNIVVGWNPETNIKQYFLIRSRIDSISNKINMNKQEIEVNRKTLEELERESDRWNNYQGTGNWIIDTINKGVWGLMAGINKGQRENLESSIASLNANIKELQDSLSAYSQGYEFYKATITLVGIPSDIPVSCILSIKPKIFESISRTQGNYMVLGATDKINTNGLFTTTINLLRLSDYGKG